jgi:hypothetical protein
MAIPCPTGPLGLLCFATQAAGSAAGTVISAASGSVLGAIAQDMANAANGLVKTLSTFWMNVRTPSLDGAGTPVSMIQGDTSWIVTSVAVACILIAAAQMAIRRKGQSAAVMAMGLTRLVIVSAAATFVVEAAGKLGDAFSADLMSSAHIGTAAWTDILDVSAISTELGINSPAARRGHPRHQRQRPPALSFMVSSSWLAE